MEEKVEKEGISIKEIFKTLLKKIKLLVLVLLGGVVVGAGFGYLTNFSEKYYGTSMEFYVNPVPTEDEIESDSYFAVNGTYTRNVMDGLVKLLSSESFAERLLMDEEGFPKFRNDENREAIDAKINVARPLTVAEVDAEEVLELAEEEQTEAQKDYNDKNAKWSAIQSEIRFLKDIGDEENAIPALTAKMNEAKEARDAAKVALEEKQEACELAEEVFKEAKKNAETARNEVYELYRKTDLYKSLIKTIRTSVVFSWYEPGDEENLETIARSFIYVSVKVDGDEKLANDLYDQICAVLPGYVSDAMPKPGGYMGTACRQITRLDEVHRLNANQALSAAIKYGFLVGFAALAITCVVVVVVDKKRKNKAQ